MKSIRLVVPVLALALLGTTASTLAQRGGWDNPPQQFREFQRRGFQDGIEGARKDVENHRRPDVNNRDEYRNPDVPRNVRRDYREAFRQGYNTGMQHLLHGGGPRR